MKKIAGVDEVGRGSLIGPVYAAAVILNETINTTQTIGLILILTGLILVDGRALNFFKR